MGRADRATWAAMGSRWIMKLRHMTAEVVELEDVVIEENRHGEKIYHVYDEEFAEGRRMARKDHFWHGRKYVKVKAAGCLEGHGWAYRRGYRDYAIHCCPVRRFIDF